MSFNSKRIHTCVWNLRPAVPGAANIGSLVREGAVGCCLRQVRCDLRAGLDTPALFPASFAWHEDAMPCHSLATFLYCILPLSKPRVEARNCFCFETGSCFVAKLI